MDSAEFKFVHMMYVYETDTTYKRALRHIGKHLMV